MRAFLITAFLCAVSAKAEGQSQAGDDPVLRRVFTNWKAHQERIRSFYFRWNEKITLLKGSIDDFRPAVPRQLRRHSEEETYYSPNVEIWVDGEDRVRQDGHAWFKTSDAKSWAQAPLVFRRTCDGRIRSEYDRFPPCLSLDPAPRAWRRGWIETVNSKEIPEAALVLALRSLRPPSAWSPDQCRVVTENAVFEGGHYVELERREQNPQTGRIRLIRCWVDPRRNDRMIAWEEWQGASNWRTWSGSIDYAKDTRFGWLPAKWKLQFTGPQSRMIESTVTSYRINESYPPTLFQPDFPPGTPVRDAPKGQQYLIETDGSKRPVTREELDRLWNVE
jgi:hypothetical protein